MFDQMVPHWFEHLAVFYMAASGIATMAVSVMPTPHEFKKNLPGSRYHGHYALAYGMVQRLSVVRQPWVRNGKNDATDKPENLDTPLPAVRPDAPQGQA